MKKITPLDPLPKTICKTCLKRVEEFHQLVKTLTKTNEKLGAVAATRASALARLNSISSARRTTRSWEREPASTSTSESTVATATVTSAPSILPLVEQPPSPTIQPCHIPTNQMDPNVETPENNSNLPDISNNSVDNSNTSALRDLSNDDSDEDDDDFNQLGTDDLTRSSNLIREAGSNELI